MEERCAVCKKSGSVVPLLDGILNDEVIKVCDECAQMEDITIVRRPTSFQIAEAQRPYTVYQRLSRMAGVNRKPGTTLPFPVSTSKVITLDRLRPSRDFSELMKKKKIEPATKSLDLVDNYNWAIQMGRRNRKITLKQLGTEIGEDPEVLKFIEQGMLTSDAERIISKLEQYLRIRLRKGKTEEPVGMKQPARILSYDPKSMKNITIDDLKKRKEAREQAESEAEGSKEPEAESENYLLGADIEIEDD